MKKKSVQIKPPKRINEKWLRKIGVKEVLIAGTIFTVTTLGVKNWTKLGPDIYKNKQAFPESGVVRVITDGDTFELQNGVKVRLIGIDAPDRGEKKYKEAGGGLGKLIEDKRVWLEYDRYQDDNTGGRILAWVWVGCESDPKFLSPEYMRLTFNTSRNGLADNPKGCKKGKLVQEELIKDGFAKVEVYKDRGELKYQERLSKVD